MSPPRSTAERGLSALDMVRNLMRSVEAIARYVDSDDPEVQIQAHIRGLGPQQHAVAQMAAQLAVCSIAESLASAADSLASIAANIAYIADDGAGTDGDPIRQIRDVPLPFDPLDDEGDRGPQDDDQ